MTYAVHSLLSRSGDSSVGWPWSHVRVSHLVLAAGILLLATGPFLHERLDATGQVQAQGLVLPTTVHVSGGDGVRSETLAPLETATLPAQGPVSVVRAPAVPGASALASEGAVFVKRPAFSASLVDHTVHVSLAWPSLSGPADAVASGSLALVDSAPRDRYALTGEATNLTVNATSSHPSLWQELFETRLTDAGLTRGHGFETATGHGWARVDVWGLMDPDPASDRYDVAADLGVQHTDVTLAG